MANTFHRLVVHLVWAVRARRLALVGQVETTAHKALARKARDIGASAVASGGTADHVHVLVRYPAAVAVAELARQLKGASTYRANACEVDDERFA